MHTRVHVHNGFPLQLRPLSNPVLSARDYHVTEIVWDQSQGHV